MNKKYDLLCKHILENQDKFYKLCYTYVRNQDDALDVVQNAIMQALKNYKKIKNVNAINTWFYRILVNENLKFIEKNKKNTIHLDKEITYNDVYKDDDLYKNIKKLSQDVQDIIFLYYFDDLLLKDIAKITNTNVNTVKTKLYNGLKKLKVQIEGEF